MRAETEISTSSSVDLDTQEAAPVVIPQPWVRPRGRSSQPTCWWVVLLIMALSAGVNVFAVLSTHLWVLPDSSQYIILAGGIADYGDFSHEYFLIRPPGYPLLLAAVFQLAGPQSPIVIQALQHSMIVAIVALTALIGWELTARRSVALLAGFFTMLSPQLLSFADVIMPEIPYALCLTAAAYWLTRYNRRGKVFNLVVASLLIGGSYLFRPMGLSLLAACGLAVIRGVLRAKSSDRQSSKKSSALREAAQRLNLRARRQPKRSFVIPKEVKRVIGRFAFHGGCAVLPCALVIAPAAYHNRVTFGQDLTDRCAKMALYYRLLVMDRLDAPDSAALKDIRTTVAEARRRGALPRYADDRQWGPVLKAFQSVKGMTLAETAGVIGEAADDVWREHPRSVLENTARYAWWMLLRPDSTYRFVPGGAAGKINALGESVRDPKALIYDIATYRPMLAGLIAPVQSYLPLTAAPTDATPFRTKIVRAYHDFVEAGSAPAGLGDSLYEELGYLCLLGMVIALLTRERFGWLLIIVVVASQVLPSAFLAGPTPRYAVPLIPLLVLLATSPLTLLEKPSPDPAGG